MWPFSRIQITVAWFVSAVAAKMTEVDRWAVQGTGTGVGDRSAWEREERDVPPRALVSGLGDRERADPLNEIPSTEDASPCPQSPHVAGCNHGDRQPPCGAIP